VYKTTIATPKCQVFCAKNLTNIGSRSFSTEPIALARDCDFLFTIYNPLDIGLKSIKEFNFRESHFMVKLDISRHTKNRSSFILSLSDSGNFAEIETEYDNEFMKRESGGTFEEKEVVAIV
jgi:hypothetical protein